jgi:hypothetical protein
LPTTDLASLGRDHHGRGDQRILGAVEIAHKGFEAAFVMQRDFLFLHAADVGQDDRHAGIEKREFAQAMLKCGVIEFGFG